jgi:hypothetical protein
MAEPLSIGDLISQFADPKPEAKEPEAIKWFKEFTGWLEGRYEKTVHAPRKPGLHASSLGKICSRRRLIIAAFGENVVPHTAGNYFTFDVGHSMHFWWQERYLGPKQELLGDWVCMGCQCPTCAELLELATTRAERQAIYRSCESCRGTGGKVTRGLMPLECECGKPWQEAVHYLELPVVNDELKYVGHTDGILDHSPKRRIFEFKTISPSEYDKLDKRGPYEDHIIQAHAYMVPLGLEEAIIVYENKGSQCKWKVNMFGQFEALEPKLKPYLIKFDSKVWDPIVERIHDDHRAVAELQAILDEGRSPTREEISAFPRICSDKKCNMAARCAVSRECFSLD